MRVVVAIAVIACISGHSEPALAGEAAWTTVWIDATVTPGEMQSLLLKALPASSIRPSEEKLAATEGERSARPFDVLVSPRATAMLSRDPRVVALGRESTALVRFHCPDGGLPDLYDISWYTNTDPPTRKPEVLVRLRGVRLHWQNSYGSAQATLSSDGLFNVVTKTTARMQRHCAATVRATDCPAPFASGCWVANLLPLTEKKDLPLGGELLKRYGLFGRCGRLSPEQLERLRFEPLVYDIHDRCRNHGKLAYSGCPDDPHASYVVRVNVPKAALGEAARRIARDLGIRTRVSVVDFIVAEPVSHWVRDRLLERPEVTEIVADCTVKHLE